MAFKVTRATLLGTAAASALVLSAVEAQAAIQVVVAEPAAQAEPSTAQVSDIVVTGTRVARAGFDAPTPTTVLGAEALEQRALPNVGDFLNEVPAFRPSQTPQTNPQNLLGGGQSFADLRGLGSIRTLTLVNGRRYVPSSATGQVDLNLIPTVMVDRIEAVTGGASAAWGSDAVAGVVNIILNSTLRGAKGDVSYGVTQEGDNETVRVGLALGDEFHEGRGHFVVGAEYYNGSGISSYNDREWGRRWEELVSFSGPRGDNPSRLYASGVTQNNQTYGGVIIGPNANPGGPLRGIQFGPGGTVLPFDYGNAIGVNAIDFTGDGIYSRGQHTLLPEIFREAATGHFKYDLTSSIQAFAELSYASAGARFRTPQSRDSSLTAIVIRRDNPFLPASVASIMDANGITSFPIGRANDDFGPTDAENFSTTTRFAAGLSGDLGGGWAWDAYYQFGRNIADSTIENLRIAQNFAYAVDAVSDPITGDPICRDAVARAAGCVPINLIGQGSPSAAAIDYTHGTQIYRVELEQSVFAANITGEPFSTWAGPVSVAAGGEYRKEETTATSDDLAANGRFTFSNPRPFAGDLSVKEVYAETVVPLAADAPFAKTLDLNAAVRYTDYSTSGGVTTWKVGATWEPFDDLRLRGTRSRDIRAPNASELFSTTSSVTTIRNPFTGVTEQTTVIFSPSPTLQPEEADTLTVGAVISPSAVPGLRFSVDYYDIDIAGAISSFTPQTVADNCFGEIAGGAPGFFCGFVDRSGTGGSTAVRSVSVQLLNVASLKARGVDFEVSYRLPLFAGHLTSRLFGTYTEDLIFDDGTGATPVFNAQGVIQSLGGVINRAGQVGGFTSGQNNGATNAPEWVLNGSLNYATDRFSATLQGRYVGGGSIDNGLVGPDSPFYDPRSPISIADNRVDSRFYVNLSGSYRLSETAEVYGSVNNVTNTEPPFPSTAVAGLYDRIGRSYSLGLRVKY
ncbi:TonB-dependent receptor [Brevundimonas sp. S30B]|uniref:TonB-dependent receptor domain-containing protein n=1 Tax=unclassified Brevundimonas TaxID=2622653 RepID=UPI001071CE76|nr:MULTISPECIES: TonB-dependent receptor [unclassified Brevundimonas]QBX36663.1 TonB-dependent receptor [Brevundimonas sp. MF30-B]TFW04542.1 TonB-dependent receptor [Brevundimonas sp. S30B]